MPLMASKVKANQNNSHLPAHMRPVLQCRRSRDPGDGVRGREEGAAQNQGDVGIPDEKAIFDEEKGLQPFVLSKGHTLSLYEKANLRHNLESWRGKQFTAEEWPGSTSSPWWGCRACSR